jgi:hypothetical protein
LQFFPRPSSHGDSSTCASCIAWVTGVYHHAWFAG